MESNILTSLKAKTDLGKRKLPLARLTFTLGAGLISAALVIGFITYQFSFDMIQRSYQKLYLSKAQMIVKLVKDELDEPDDVVLSDMFSAWEASTGRPPDEYICVVDNDSKLILHSADPETVGNFIGDNPVLGETTAKEKKLGSLIQAHQDYVGRYISSAGKDQIAAFVPIPKKNWMLGVHRSKALVEKELQEGFRPFAFGFILVCGMLMPLTLGFLYKTFNAAQRKQQQYAAALQNSENRYHSLVETLPHELYRTDLAGRITFANRTMLENLDVELDECLGRTAFDFYPEEVAKRYLEQDLKIIRTGATLDVIDHQHTPGRDDRYVQIIKTPVYDTKGKIVGIQGISCDVTEKKLAEDKLEDTRAHLEALLQWVPSGIIAVNMEGRLTIINQEAEKILGIDAAKSVGRHITEIIPDTSLLKVIDAKKAELGKVYHWDEKTLVVSRSPIYRGEVILGGVSVFQDQSEIESVQKQLKDMQRLHNEISSLVENSYDGVLITDTQKVLKVNSSFGRITGLAAISLENRDISELDSERHVCMAVVQEICRYVIQQRKALTLIRNLRSGNEIFVTGSPVLDSTGHVERIVMNVRDVTDLKSREEQIEELCRGSRSTVNNCASAYNGIVAESPAMRNLKNLCERLSQVDSTVLLFGETGVGKDVLTCLIHRLSNRREKPFISINCGAIPENLLESELFGYEKGAFSGAVKEGKAGLFEQANGGIVFLDEISEMPLGLQVKLLKVIQDQRLRRVGSKSVVNLDVRIMAATNRDLRDLVEKGEFREDLFYRLYVVPVEIPPLRERREDIMPLALQFLRTYNKKYGLSCTLSNDVLKSLEAYDWPGNIRELQNVIERMVVTAKSEMLEPEHLPDNIYKKEIEPTMNLWLSDVMDLRQARENLERQLITKALAETDTTRAAAKLLGVTHSTVIRKIQKLGQENFEKYSGYKH